MALYSDGNGKYDDEYNELFCQLVPDTGDCDTDGGNALNFIARLASEYYRNGNMNWNREFLGMAKWLDKTVAKSEFFDAKTQKAIANDIKRVISNGKTGSCEYLDGEDEYDRVTDRVVEWCLHEFPLAKEPRPKKTSITKKLLKELFKSIERKDLNFISAFIDKHPSEINIFGAGGAHYRDKTLLMYAVQCNRIEMIEPLVALGADVNARMRSHQNTPVLNFALGEFTPYGILEFLLRHGADPNQYDYLAVLPLRLAIEKVFSETKDCLKKVEVLLDAGANPDLLPTSEHPDVLPTTCRDYIAHLQEHFPNELPERLFKLIPIAKEKGDAR